MVNYAVVHNAIQMLHSLFWSTHIRLVKKSSTQNHELYPHQCIAYVHT